MTASAEASDRPDERVTLDELKHRAEALKDLAVSETRAAVRRVFAEDSTKVVLAVAGAVVLAVSFAYLAGARAGARRRMPLSG